MNTIWTINPTNPDLIETTTLIQRSRGNRKFYDQKHKVSYITYANGYVRREVNAIATSSWNGSQFKVQDQFVINKRKSWKVSYKSLFGKTKYTNTNKIVKEHCPQKRMDMIDRISSNYKGYAGRFSYPGYKLIA